MESGSAAFLGIEWLRFPKYGGRVRATFSWLGMALLATSVPLVSCKKAPGEGQRKTVEDAGYAMTPADFLRAAESDDIKALEAMIAAGMAVETADAEGRTALHAAAAAGAQKVVGFLLDRRMDINVADQSGRTPLMEAVLHANPEMVRDLLRQGADPSLKDEGRYKPLMLAVKEGKAEMVAELAPYVRQDLDDALLAAAILGEADVIDELTNYGASIYARVEDGRTPLMLAAQHGRVEAVEMLLDIGANRFTMDTQGRIAADLAREAGYEDLGDRLAGEPAEGDFVLSGTESLAEEMVAEVEDARMDPPSGEGDGAQGGAGDEEGAIAANGDGAADLIDPEGEQRDDGSAGIDGPGVQANSGSASPAAGNGRSAGPAVAAVELEGVVVGGGPAEVPAPVVPSEAPATTEGGGPARLNPPVVMRAYRQNELPLRVDSTSAETAVVQVVGGAKHEVAVGANIPGSSLKVVRISRKMQSGKENEGVPVEVSVVTVSDDRSGVVRDLTVGLPALAHEPVALVEDASTGKYYVARTGQRFRTADGDDFLVGDVRPNQIVVENLKTGETRTILLSGPRG